MTMSRVAETDKFSELYERKLHSFQNLLLSSCNNVKMVKKAQRRTQDFMSTDGFLRTTAVPAGTAEARTSYGNSVCPSVRLSVCHDPVVYQAQVR